MNDLLGDPLPETPAMTASLPWRVFRLTDYEWWVARTLDEAKEDAAREWGYSVEQAERDEIFDDPEELSDEQMALLTFREDMYDPKSERRTFSAQLSRLIQLGIDKPGLFACTES